MIFDKINFFRSVAYGLRPHYSALFRQFSREALAWEKLSVPERKEWILQRCRTLVCFAYENVPFYRDYYRQKHFSPDALHSFADLRRIPVIDKKTLCQVPLERRTSTVLPRYCVNTGGSSGVSLGFYVDRHLGPKERAYMHYMWHSVLGFKPSMTRLRLTGRSNIQAGIDYSYFQNIINWDIYSDFSKVAAAFKSAAQHLPPVYFLHGYPSALYEFALYCETDAELYSLLKRNLQGILFCSEFPFDRWRDKIEAVFGVKTLSWYGHTEACILAYEKREKKHYVPLQSYGLAEILPVDGNECHLVGTDYFNFASPLIRYDTEDLADQCEFESELLTSFQIKNGRAGQFIHDRNNKKIALTGLIFGRHHKLFDYCSNIQIAEVKPGEAVVLYVLKNSMQSLKNPEALFNTENVDIQFEFREIPAPIRTKRGKVHLLVPLTQLTADECTK